MIRPEPDSTWYTLPNRDDLEFDLDDDEILGLLKELEQLEGTVDADWYYRINVLVEREDDTEAYWRAVGDILVKYEKIAQLNRLEK